MKCGAGLDAGILRHGMDIEYLVGMPMEAMAMVIPGELCRERKS
jgi:hypothetical protein